MLACDFFVVDTVWLTQLYVFFFIEVGSRCVRLAGCTYNPTTAWAVQQARNVAWELQDGTLSAKFLLRDRDSKFTTAFGSSDCPARRPSTGRRRAANWCARIGSAA